jgi:ribose 5-phosphate isomerase B
MSRVVGIAADHGGFALKRQLVQRLGADGYPVFDLGAYRYVPSDDYPARVVPLARAVAAGEVWRGVAVCGSGVGACIAANRVAGVRAALVGDPYTARQGVEDDDMNLICLGERVTGPELAWDLVQVFLAARFHDEERHRRRLEAIAALE